MFVDVPMFSHEIRFPAVPRRAVLTGGAADARDDECVDSWC